MTDNVVKLPVDQAPQWIIGPFTEHRVVIEDRVIPRLTARDKGNSVDLILDGRFSVPVPKDSAYQVAWLIANALAIGAGYACLSSETKEQPFAPKCFRLGED